jgi:hypothetical protein
VRWGLLALLLQLAACESHYGAYFEIKGDIELDQVELYFGAPLAPGSPGLFATPTFGVLAGQLFDRVYEVSDEVTVSPRKQTTYYVEANETNQALGAYVVVVALSGGRPVGIGEYFNFKVPSDAVYEYSLTLVPWNPAEAERWGDKPGCVAWKRQRGGNDIAAIVHKNDRDCDVLDQTVDCNDLCTTGSTLCDASQTLCLGQCALGCNFGGICVAKQCLPTSACDSNCLGLTDPGARFRCAIERAGDHLRIFVDTIEGTMCSHMYQFRLSLDTSVACIDPKFEYQDVTSGFGYQITADPTNPGDCVISSTQSSVVAFTSAHTFVVSFADADPTKPRRSVIISVEPGATPCQTMGYHLEPAGSIYDCN